MRKLIIVSLSLILLSCDELDIRRVEAIITSIEPAATVAGSKITISGSNFTPETTVQFGSIAAEIISISATAIEAYVPLDLNDSNIEITVDALGPPASFSFEILPFFVERTRHPDGAFGGAGFVIDNTLYFGGGGAPFYQYNSNSDTWTPLNANNAAPNKASAIGVAVNGKGYILGTGLDGELWEYDPISNDWTQKSSYTNGQLIFPAVLVIDSDLYLVTGFQGSISRQVWRYSTATDSWTQLNNYAGVKRGDAVGFVIDGVGYVGQGYDFDTNSFLNDFYSYDVNGDSWSEVAAPLQPSGNLESAVGFNIGNNGYIGLGRRGNQEGDGVKDFWQYNPSEDTWRIFATYPGNGVMNVQSYVLNDKVYLLNGSDQNFSENFIEMWEFTPETL